MHRFGEGRVDEGGQVARVLINMHLAEAGSTVMDHHHLNHHRHHNLIDGGASSNPPTSQNITGNSLAGPLYQVVHLQQQQQQQQQQQPHTPLEQRHPPVTPLTPLQHPHLAQHNGSFGGSDNWVDMNAYDHNPMPDYGNYGYMQPVAAHGLPSPESMSRMPPPSLSPMHPHQHPHQQHPHQHPHPHSHPHPHQPHQPHHQLPMLIMPSNATWPSMLTNPQSYSAPPMGAMPMPHTGKPRLPGMPQSTPRRTLTDDDRRRMCQYHEDNPTVKQTEIGAMFGVERSTVSKVLRNREKYLFPDDRNNSPIKRASKGKFPDIERALASWARKAQQSGADLSDSEIWEKARHFARGIGGSTESHVKTLSSSWLEKFKQKNGIGPGGRLIRRASEASIIGAARRSVTSPSLTPASPTSGPSPLSTSRSDEELRGNSFLGFNQVDYAKGSNATQSGATASSYPPPPDTATSSFTADLMSPSATFTFSPDASTGVFMPGGDKPLPPGAFQRPRSQTFPTLDLEYMDPDEAAKYTQGGENDNAIASDMESPLQETPSHPFPVDAALSSPQPRTLHHARSMSSLVSRTSTTPLSTTFAPSSATTAGSSPTSPTQEDARRAADTLLNFFQSLGSTGQLLDQQEYMTVVRLTERLRLQSSSSSAHSRHGSLSGPSSASAAAEPHSIGGLARIPEGDDNEPLAAPIHSPRAETSS